MKKTLLSVATVTALTGVASSNISAADYTVENGDTLWGIANESGTSVSELKSVNGLSSDLILPGDVLEVDGEVSEEETVEQENDGTYVVKAGDTLFKIGQEFGVDYTKIMEWNNLSSDLIFPGKTLIVSEAAAPAVEEVEEAPQVEEAPEVEETGTAQAAEVEEAPAVEEAPEVEEDQTAQAAEVEEAPQVEEQPEAPAAVADNNAAEERAQAEEQARIEQREAQQAQAQEAQAQQAEVQQTSSVGGNAASVANSMAAGKSYVYGGNSAGAVDCSAFTQQFMKQYKGVDIPRTVSGQQAAGTPTSNPQPGDLVVFNNGTHVGVYIGGGQMVDALNPSEGVGQRAVSYVHGHVDGYYTF